MKSVTICTSKKYAQDAAAFAKKLRELGMLVYEPNFEDGAIVEDQDFKSEHVKNMVFKGLTLEHFEWLRRSDVCYVLNAAEYCGTSVTMEMGYAYALGKPIIAYAPKTGDECRDLLIDFIAETPEKLVELLTTKPFQQVLR